MYESYVQVVCTSCTIARTRNALRSTGRIPSRSPTPKPPLLTNLTSLYSQIPRIDISISTNMIEFSSSVVTSSDDDEGGTNYDSDSNATDSSGGSGGSSGASASSAWSGGGGGGGGARASFAEQQQSLMASPAASSHRASASGASAWQRGAAADESDGFGGGAKDFNGFDGPLNSGSGASASLDEVTRVGSERVGMVSGSESDSGGRLGAETEGEAEDGEAHPWTHPHALPRPGKRGRAGAEGSAAGAEEVMSMSRPRAHSLDLGQNISTDQLGAFGGCGGMCGGGCGGGGVCKESERPQVVGGDPTLFNDTGLTASQASKLLVLICHSRSCPGHHHSKQHAEVCKSTKVS